MQETAKEVTQEEKEASDVRVSIGGGVAVECSAMSAAKILKEFFRSPEREPFHQVRAIETPPPALIKPPDTDGNQFREDRQSGNRVKRFISLAAFMAILIILFLYAGGGYLENYKSQASATANHEMNALSSKAYDKILAEHADELLENLKELTAITKKISMDSLYSAATTHRGRNPATIARETKMFILETKNHFDEWTARPNDWPEKQQPTKDDIADFLSIWEKRTKPLLNRLQEAQNNPLDFLIKEAQLPRVVE